MTKEEFIKVLKKRNHPYKIKGDKIVVTGEGYVQLSDLTSLPPDVEFRNKDNVWLTSLTSLPPGVVFMNGGDVYLESLTDEWFNDWSGNIEGIDSNRLLNFMINKGMFI